MDSLAQRLRSGREQQGLSVRELSIITKIREPYIVAIEDGRYDILPAVYVRSFIRTLAHTLGMGQRDIQELMNEAFDPDDSGQERLPRADERRHPNQPNVISEAVQRASRSLERPVGAVRGLAASNVLRDALARKNAFLYIIAAVLVISALAYLVFFYVGHPDRSATSIPELEVKLNDVPSVQPADSLILTAIVTDTAWMTVTADGSRTFQVTLIPGVNYRWSANNKFVLSISNAGGVRFARNGQALPLFGNQGEAVRSVQITRSEIISSAQTRQPGADRRWPPPAQTASRPLKRNSRQKSIDPRSTPLITPAPSKNPISRQPPQNVPRD